MKLLTYKVKGNPKATLVDKLVAFGTFSNYSHSELMFSDSTIFSSSPRDGGVRIKKLDGIKETSWDITDIDVTEEEEAYIKELCNFFIKKKIVYDYTGAILSATPVCVPNGKMFCSEAINKVIGHIIPVPNPSASIPPNKLKKFVEEFNIIKESTNE